MTYINGIANYFNLHNLKKRINMMNKEKTQPVYKIKWLLLIPVATVILLSFNMKRAIATNVDFVVNSEIFEPEPAVIKTDTLAGKNFKSEKIYIRCDDSAKSKPLIIINGKELNADSVSSFDILKDESKIRLYGKKGKNGVVIVKYKECENKDSKTEDEIKTKENENDSISNTLEIRLPKDSSDKAPLIIIDDKESDSKKLHELNADSIFSFSIVKNEAAIKLYGEKGKNGVIIVKLKEYENKDSKTGDAIKTEEKSSDNI
jgi:hypothetical protein